MATQPDRYFAADDELETESDPARTAGGEPGPYASAAAPGASGEDPDVIVAEVIDEEPVSRTGAKTAAEPLSGTEPSLPGVEPSLDGAASGRAAEHGNGALSQQWHDIQAMFVDDPRGSVQLAAQAADDAVGALVDSLHQRQSALEPAGSPAGAAGPSDTERPSDTEQLREALRSYRVFCEAVGDLSHRLPQTSGIAR